MLAARTLRFIDPAVGRKSMIRLGVVAVLILAFATAR
jgi:hypothetical protein